MDCNSFKPDLKKQQQNANNQVSTINANIPIIIAFVF